jgi:hypothetical protein
MPMYDRSAFLSIIPSVQNSNYKTDEDGDEYGNYQQEFRSSERLLVHATRTIGTEDKRMGHSGRQNSGSMSMTANYHPVASEKSQSGHFMNEDHDIMTVSAAREAMRIIARLQQQEDDNRLQDRFPFLSPDATILVEAQVILFFLSKKMFVLSWACVVLTNMGTLCA